MDYEPAPESGVYDPVPPPTITHIDSFSIRHRKALPADGDLVRNIRSSTVGNRIGFVL